MKRLICKLLADTRGGTAIEYGFILALVVLALMVALFAFAETATDIWDNVATRVTASR